MLSVLYNCSIFFHVLQCYYVTYLYQLTYTLVLSFLFLVPIQLHLTLISYSIPHLLPLLLTNPYPLPLTLSPLPLLPHTPSQPLPFSPLTLTPLPPTPYPHTPTPVCRLVYHDSLEYWSRQDGTHRYHNPGLFRRWWRCQQSQVRGTTDWADRIRVGICEKYCLNIQDRRGDRWEIPTEQTG